MHGYTLVGRSLEQVFPWLSGPRVSSNGNKSNSDFPITEYKKLLQTHLHCLLLFACNLVTQNPNRSDLNPDLIDI